MWVFLGMLCSLRIFDSFVREIHKIGPEIERGWWGGFWLEK